MTILATFLDTARPGSTEPPFVARSSRSKPRPTRTRDVPIRVLVELHDAQVPLADIVEVTGVSAKNIRRRLKATGRRFPRPVRAPLGGAVQFEQRRTRIYALVAERMTYPQIAGVLGLHPKSVYGWIRRHLPDVLPHVVIDMRAPSWSPVARKAALARWRRVGVTGTS